MKMAKWLATHSTVDDRSTLVNTGVSIAIIVFNDEERRGSES